MLQVQASPLERVKASTQELHEAAIERVIRTMRERLHEPLSLEDMADIACLSPFYFNRVFRQAVGVPPGEFLAALRLDAAKRLLLTTDLQVTDICFEVGYIGLGSFTTRFTQLVGVSPRLLRHLAKNVELSDEAEQYEVLRRPSPIKGIIPIRFPAVLGELITPDPFCGDIYIGLFPRPVPQGKPVRCTMLHMPGTFVISDIPVGTYYLLAAAFPHSSDPHTYLLPSSDVLVHIQGPITVEDHDVVPLEVHMRPWRVTDPPIVSALPFL